ncbi:hypothetical protein H920_13328 [Fukomys damarensis]|uniref:Uncharacterized protein n=1 Tax=Fukomys damarensis TaxID=885580 RepID=A0A091D438_FUKDA|nr:hypothetical protein H920_13328 [Fukomys damarensis]
MLRAPILLPREEPAHEGLGGWTAGQAVSVKDPRFLRIAKPKSAFKENERPAALSNAHGLSGPVTHSLMYSLYPAYAQDSPTVFRESGVNPRIPGAAIQELQLGSNSFRSAHPGQALDPAVPSRLSTGPVGGCTRRSTASISCSSSSLIFCKRFKYVLNVVLILVRLFLIIVSNTKLRKKTFPFTTHTEYVPDDTGNRSAATFRNNLILVRIR